jgi:hypothetical protein
MKTTTSMAVKKASTVASTEMTINLNRTCT